MDDPKQPVAPATKKIALTALATAAISPILLPFTEWAQNNPALALPLVAVWELILLVASFALDVWSEVRGRFVRRAADRVELWVGDLVLGHRNRYLQDVIHEHRNFDVKGLSTQSTFTLELEQVFVDLSVAPIAPHEASADMLRQLPEDLREGRHDLWDFLQTIEGESAKLALLGAPGSGKTTLLKHVALTFAHGRSPTPKLTARRNLPILLFLREHAAVIASRPESDDVRLSELIAAHLKQREREIPAAWFDAQLNDNRCLVMLDGLDEVADAPTRVRAAKWVDKQMSIHDGNSFIVTSRPHGYASNPLNGVTVLDVRPFTGEQVARFVHQWYLANEIKAQQRDDPGVQQDAKQGARDLLARLNGAPALTDLAVNPLLLTMIATVHRYRSSLPGRRVELYAEICEVSLGKRQQSKGIELDLTPAQKQRVLEPLAWHMMRERKREIAKDEAVSVITPPLALVSLRINATDFLVSIENDTSLLLEREGGIYSFAHLTFQEFLAACHAQQQPNLLDILIRNVGDSWWRECLRLFSARGDATPIIRACTQGNPPDAAALALAIECRKEAKEIEPDARTKLDHLVEVGLDEADPNKRRPIAEAMLKVRLGRMRRLDEHRYIDPDLITHAEYQLFLDEGRAKGDDRRPDHWTDTHFTLGEGRKPIVGLRFSDALAFCVWLTEREGGQWRFRPPTCEENGSVEAAHEASDIAPWKLINAGIDLPAGTWPARVQARHMELIDKATKGLSKLADFNRALDLARALARALDLDFVRAVDLALDRRTLARARGRDLARDLDLDLARDLALALARDLARARARAHALVLALSDLNPALGDLVLDPVPARALALARALARNLARALALDRTLDHTLDRTLALARLLSAFSEFQFYYIRGRDFAPDAPILILVLAFASACTHDVRINRTDAHILDLTLASALALCFVISPNLFHFTVRSGINHPIAFLRIIRWRSRVRRQQRENFNKGLTRLAIVTFLLLQIATVLIRARLSGEDPPFEALRLVRERMSEGGEPKVKPSASL